MSEITRRDVLSRLASAFVAAGAIDTVLAREAHAQVHASTLGAFTPAALDAHQYATLQRLADLIIPVDNGKPGALGTGVPEWIDALLHVNDELKRRYIDGLAWIDTTMRARSGEDFVSASPAQQTALLDEIAFMKNRTATNATGVDFFVLLRRMTVDGYYTSDAGILDINPGGRPPKDRFTVPQEDIDHVIAHSPFRGEPAPDGLS